MWIGAGSARLPDRPDRPFPPRQGRQAAGADRGAAGYRMGRGAGLELPPQEQGLPPGVEAIPAAAGPARTGAVPAAAPDIRRSRRHGLGRARRRRPGGRARRRAPRRAGSRGRKSTPGLPVGMDSPGRPPWRLYEAPRVKRHRIYRGGTSAAGRRFRPPPAGWRPGLPRLVSLLRLQGGALISRIRWGPILPVDILI